MKDKKKLLLKIIREAEAKQIKFLDKCRKKNIYPNGFECFCNAKDFKELLACSPGEAGKMLSDLGFEPNLRGLCQLALDCGIIDANDENPAGEGDDCSVTSSSRYKCGYDFWCGSADTIIIFANAVLKDEEEEPTEQTPLSDVAALVGRYS